ncbi:MAG: glutamyl-tRNA reductase [Nitriliruptorales bacterium]|nr:glutamyl-tRNA reductase [Nitriliruptorales bacterium]
MAVHSAAGYPRLAALRLRRFREGSCRRLSVLVLGLNYKTAPVGLLERVAVPTEQLPKALHSLCKRDHVLEAVVLSTCNRVEVYVHATRFHGAVADVRNFFSEWSGLPPEDFVDATYDHFDERAAAHLFAVASGLESMVVGERQIHLQVKQAFQVAETEHSCGRLLQNLFRQALHVARRARAETGISEGAASMVDAGLDAATQVLEDLRGRTVLIVGAGKMGGMAAGRVRGAADTILIANRSAEKARRLAERVDGSILDLGQLTDGLATADLVLTSTGAPAPVIDQDIVAAAMMRRPDRPLVLVDLAVPRDVDPGCSFVPGVTVLDVDAIRTVTDTGQTGDEVAKARELVNDAASRFAAWRRSVQVGPTIAALRARAEEVRAAEIERLGGRLSDLDDRQREALDSLTKGIINTLLHEPSVRLKAIADARGDDTHAAAVRELFDLPE